MPPDIVLEYIEPGGHHVVVFRRGLTCYDATVENPGKLLIHEGWNHRTVRAAMDAAVRAADLGADVVEKLREMAALIDEAEEKRRARESRP